MTATRDVDFEHLRRAHEDARASWPGIDVPFEAFAAFVSRSAAQLPREQAAGPAVTELHLGDLYLACACAQDVPGAVQRVLDTYREAIGGVARRLGLTFEARDDLVQILGERLFVTTEDGAPRIARYTGTGPLRAWIKAIATRIALDIVRRGPRDAPGVDAPPEEMWVTAVVDAPDVRFAKEMDRGHLRAALRSAFDGLSPQDKNLLRYALLDGLGIDELARIYQVHRATAARRLVSARDRLADAVKQYLRTNLGLDEAECMSLVNNGLSQVDLTLRTSSRGEP